MNNENELGYLCKTLHTSIPEQYIYTCIKQLFPKTIRSKRFNWLLYNAEFDIFIPELKLAIEYDGLYWHKNKPGLSDMEKNELAHEHKITMFRIREKGLQEPDCPYFLYNFDRSYKNIAEPINAIINFINTNYNMNISQINQIDFFDLERKTLSNLRSQLKDLSIAKSWKEIGKYWDYICNKNIKPEYVKRNSKTRYKVICPYCNKSIEFIPRLSFIYYGSYSFVPHICLERDNYCMWLLDNKFRNQDIKIDMRNLADRRLRDWLIGIVRSNALHTKIKNISAIEKKLGFELNWANLINHNIATLHDLNRVADRDFEVNPRIKIPHSLKNFINN